MCRKCVTFVLRNAYRRVCRAVLRSIDFVRTWSGRKISCSCWRHGSVQTLVSVVSTGITTTSPVDLGDEAIWGGAHSSSSTPLSRLLSSFSPPFSFPSLSLIFLSISSFSSLFPSPPSCFAHSLIFLFPPVLYLSAAPLVQGVGSAVSSQAGFGAEPWPPTHF